MEKIVAVYCQCEVVGFIETDYPIKETKEKLAPIFKALKTIERKDMIWNYILISITAMDDPKIRVKSVDCSFEIDYEGNYIF